MSNDRALRLGIRAWSSVKAAPTLTLAATVNWVAHPIVEIDGSAGRPAALSVQSGLTPFSANYGVTGKFGGFSESVKIAGGASWDYLFNTNDLEVSGLRIFGNIVHKLTDDLTVVTQKQEKILLRYEEPADLVLAYLLNT